MTEKTLGDCSSNDGEANDPKVDAAFHATLK